MDIDNTTLHQLVQFGLTEYEAKVYATLIHKGPQKASALAIASEIPRPHVYATLKSLQEKGMILLIPKKVVEYEATPPEEALEKLIEDRKRSLEKLELIGKDLAQKLENRDKAREAEDERLLPLNMCEGHWNILNIARDMLSRCKTNYDVITNNPRDSQFSSRDFDREMQELYKRPIAMRVVLPIVPENVEILKKLGNKVTIKHSIGPEVAPFSDGLTSRNSHLRVIIIDSREALFVMADEDGREFALHIKHKDLVKITMVFFNHVWNNSQDFADRLRELDSSP